jgi:hypothetical protein
MVKAAAFLMSLAAVSSVASVGHRIEIAAGRSKSAPLRRIAELDPVGKYALNAVMRGTPTSLAATILKLADGSLGGDLSGSSINSVKIIEVQIQDSTLKFAVNATEDIKASFVLIVSGDSISGRWSMPGDSSTVSGHRVHDKPAGTRPQ